MHNFFFIVNSRIGEKKMAQLKSAVAKYSSNYSIQIHYTNYGGHATVLAKEALIQKSSVVVAVGGDGTVNEVVQVLAHSETALGIVPTGSGNGLARHCHIPLQIEKSVDNLFEGKPMKIDLGKANAVYFISNAGVGFDAVVCNDIKQTKSRGLKMYIRKVIAHYFTYKADEYELIIDGVASKRKAFFLNVANGKEFGYGFEIAPEATLQDGLLDMISVEKINFANGFTFVWDGWRKKLIRNKHCFYKRAKKISIKGHHLHYFQTDGDAHDCNGECSIEICENALSLLVPQSIDKL